MKWPRVPLPGWPDSETEGAAVAIARSAAHGRNLAALLNPETPVPGITRAPLRPELTAIAVPSTVAGRYMAGEDFAVAAGWGYSGRGGVVMPGRCRIVEPAYRPEERAAFAEQHLAALGETTFDVYLNGEAFRSNIPVAVRDYRLGGYRVLKK